MPQSSNRLDRVDLIDGLGDLVRRLHNDGQNTAVYLVGGAVLSLRYFPYRDLTDDIDAKIHPAARALKHAGDIAHDRGWGLDWLNTSAETFIPLARDAGWETLFDDNTVSVWVASPECLLAMKLNAARRGRDDEDIALLLSLLDIRSAETAEGLFEDFYPGEILQQRAVDILADIFSVGLPPVPVPPPRPDLGSADRS